MIQNAIEKVRTGQHLSTTEMAEVIGIVMGGGGEEAEIGSFLTALREKGETVDEVAGAALAMRRHMTSIHTQRQGVLDTCGTGGDGSGTFNISTAAALVTAAAGVCVAKHGNRAITSKTGSADVLSELGVNVAADMVKVEECLDQLGICFCFAPLAHPAMKYVAAVRKKLRVPTIFNLLGPLCNPAHANFQLLGVGKPELRPLLAAALAKLDMKRVVVVCGEDGMDEVTLTGATHVTEVRQGHLSEFTWHPADFGLEVANVESMLVDGPGASAAKIREILAGHQGPSRDIVVLNAAAALWTAGKDASVSICAQLAAQSIDSGQAAELLAKLAELSNT